MPRLAAIVAGLTAIFFGFAASSQIVEHQPNISLTVVSREPAAWYPAWITVSPTNPKCTIASQASDVQGGVVWKFSRAGCDEERKLALNIYVIGDSHAMTYAPMFTRLALQSGIDIFAYNNGGCPFVSLQLKGLAPHCISYGNAAVADILPRLKKGDIVFLPSLRLPRLVDQWEDFGIEQAHNLMFGADGVKGRKLGEQQAIELLKLFTDKGAVVILEAPKPVFRYVLFRCSDWFNKNNPICSHGNSIPRAFLEELRAPVLESYAQLQAINPSIRVWDPFPVLCTSISCSTWRDNKPLFFDGDHLSGYGNEVLVASFRDFVASQH